MSTAGTNLAPPEPAANPAARLDAVRRRDASADGKFVYSVRTTGIYCKPSCPSRPAKTENIAFHAGPAEAEAAGFRPCRKCRPDGATTSTTDHAGAVARACRLLAEAEDAPDLASLSAAVHLSPSHFHRLFKATTGITPRAYFAAERHRRLKAGIERGESITTAIYGAGYGSSSRFYESATQRLGMRASDFRHGAANEPIRFALGECSLGTILVAATAKGIVTIELGDDPQTLIESLQARFARSELVGGDADFEQTVAAVITAVESPSRAAALPLDIRGTAFQERVWRALTEIPTGETRTYTEIAASIGQPSATRAVANACGANALAVVIPCHRVIRTDGGLGGYRWGIDRKQALLARESRKS